MPWLSGNPEIFTEEAVRAANEAVKAMRAAMDNPQLELTEKTPDRVIKCFDLAAFFPVQTVDSETFTQMFEHGDTAAMTTYN